MDGIRTNETTQTTAGAEPSLKPRAAEDGAGQSVAGRQPKISNVQAGLLVAAALLFDGTQFAVETLFGLTVFLMPLGIAASWVIDIIAWLAFLLWLKGLGLGMIKKDGASGLGLWRAPFTLIHFAFGLEFIPIFNALPAWTAAITAIVLRERAASLASLAGYSHK